MHQFIRTHKLLVMMLKYHCCYSRKWRVMVVLNDTVNNISVISWR